MWPWPERPRRFRRRHVAGVRGMPIALGGRAPDAQRGSLPQLRAVDAKWGRSAGLPSAQKTAPNLRPTPLVRTPEPAARYEIRQPVHPKATQLRTAPLVAAEETGLVSPPLQELLSVAVASGGDGNKGNILVGPLEDGVAKRGTAQQPAARAPEFPATVRWLLAGAVARWHVEGRRIA